MRKYLTYTLLLSLCFTVLTSCDNNNKSAKELASKVFSLEEKLIDRNNEMEKLILESDKLKKKIKALENDELTDNKVELVEGEVEMYPRIIQREGEDMKPASESAAKLIPYIINNSKNLYIIKKGENYSKVKLVGYVPTWYLTANGSRLHDMNVDKYIITDTDLHISPDKGDKVLRRIVRGRAVDVKYEWKDWYYVSLKYRTGSPQFLKGWIEKSKTGSKTDFNDIKGIDIQIKKDSDDYKKIKKVLGEHYTEIWGYIRLEESENTYTISFPGTYYKEVDKSNVLFIGDY